MRSACPRTSNSLEHEAGLDGFAETDLVGEQQPGRLTTKDGKRRLQLVGEQVDPGRRGGLEGNRAARGHGPVHGTPGTRPCAARRGGRRIGEDGPVDRRERASFDEGPGW